jgi:hypothetical protein
MTCDLCKIEVTEAEANLFGFATHPCGHTLCEFCCCPGVPAHTPGHICRCDDDSYNGGAHGCPVTTSEL